MDQSTQEALPEVITSFVVMGPVTKPSGGGLGPPAERNKQRGPGGLAHVERLVMDALGQRSGTTAVFQRACQFGMGGWSYTQWGARRVSELFYQESTEEDRAAASAAEVAAANRS